MREKNSRGEWSSSGSREVIRVPCFDFSAWLRSLLEQPVVKIDVEGAEFPILKRMVDEVPMLWSPSSWSSGTTTRWRISLSARRGCCHNCDVP